MLTVKTAHFVSFHIFRTAAHCFWSKMQTVNVFCYGHLCTSQFQLVGFFLNLKKEKKSPKLMTWTRAKKGADEFFTFLFRWLLWTIQPLGTDRVTLIQSYGIPKFFFKRILVSQNPWVYRFHYSTRRKSDSTNSLNKWDFELMLKIPRSPWRHHTVAWRGRTVWRRGRDAGLFIVPSYGTDWRKQAVIHT